jgi:hypothetical protein
VFITKGGKTGIFGGAASGASFGAGVGGYMEQLGGGASGAGSAGAGGGGAPDAGLRSSDAAAAAEAQWRASLPGGGAGGVGGSGAAAPAPAVGTQAWADSFGYAGLKVDKNGYWQYRHDRGFDTWSFPGFDRAIKYVP